MALNDAFANGLGAPGLGVLGFSPQDPSQPQTGLLPTPPAMQPSLGVLGMPGDPASLFPPSADPYQLAGAGPQNGGDLSVMAAQLRALQAIRDHLSIAAGWLTPSQGQNVGELGASTDPAPAVQPPPLAVTASRPQPPTAMTPTNDSALRPFEPFAGYSPDRSFTVGRGDADGTAFGIARQLYPDNPVAGLSLLAQSNRLRPAGDNSPVVVQGQTLTAPDLPKDAASLAALGRGGRAMLSANDQGLKALDAQRAAAAQRQEESWLQPPAFTQALSAGLNPWTHVAGTPIVSSAAQSPSDGADSMLGPGPDYDWHADPGVDPNAKPTPDWRDGASRLLGQAFAPEWNVYQYGIVKPFWAGIHALADSPLADPGVAQTIESSGPPGLIASGALATASKVLRGLDAAAEAAEAETEAEASGIRLIGGKAPPNSQYAGQTYPLEKLSSALQEKYPNSVDFTDDGFPDYSPYAKEIVNPPFLTGIRAVDRRIANRILGFKKNLPSHDWHHHQNGKTMMLIPSDIHRAIPHWGGVKVIKSLQ